MCKLNPKVDFVFKKLFGSEENKCILISFINSIISEENQIKNIELKNPYNISNYRKGKMTILDIKAVDEKGIWYDIEMQIAEQGYYDKRALYYWSKVYSDQIESGDDFELLRKTIGINILDFNYLKEEDFHNTYKIYNKVTKEEFSDLFEMHFIELNKFKKDYKDIKTALDRWVSFLNRAYEIDKDEIPKELGEDENIKIAIEKLDIMYLDKEEREIYENDLKALRIHKAEIKTAEEKGIKKGREEGEKKKAFEIAKNLLDVLDNETIAIKTVLTIDEIEKLR
ncbi:Rpn family recombination-promoting nuclease/putative transposase [Clostridium beijerinckii]|uniref:Rpn family recombination-promoting nuclease/putative transposase n=1 Tax=Clostridium beijerinckii TaxID=1520 RepID=UPI0003185324|nr:Rpn family recombination-promoting nuclease/putative transposase [Clostridium beijerinckii]